MRFLRPFLAPEAEDRSFKRRRHATTPGSTTLTYGRFSREQVKAMALLREQGVPLQVIAIQHRIVVGYLSMLLRRFRKSTAG